MPARIVFGLSTLGVGAMIACIITAGNDLKKPIPKWKVRFLKTLSWSFANTAFFFIGFKMKYFEVQTDYSKYLGPNWEQELKEREKPVSTIVSNHIGFMDLPIFFGSPWIPGFTPKYQAQNVPGLG